ATDKSPGPFRERRRGCRRGALVVRRRGRRSKRAGGRGRRRRSHAMTEAAGQKKTDLALEARERLRLWLRLLACTTTIEQAIRARLRAEFHTSLPRFDVLAILARSDAGLTMGELSRRLMVSNGNVTGLV